MMKSTKLKAVAMTMAGAIVAAAPRLAERMRDVRTVGGDSAFHAYKASVLFMLAMPYFSFAAIRRIDYVVPAIAASESRSQCIDNVFDEALISH